MDSYRPNQPHDKGEGTERRRDNVARRGHEESNLGNLDTDSRNPTRRVHDSRGEENGSRDSYYDHDVEIYTNRSRYDGQPRMDYDDDRRADLTRSKPEQSAQHSNFNYSDVLRYGAQHSMPPNTGEKDRDVSDNPSRYLLIRDIKVGLSELLLAKGLEKLYRGACELESGAAPLSLRSVMIVRVRGQNDGMGYGFAEYHTVHDAKAAREKSKQLGKQCTVSSQRFQADYPHNGVFPDASIPEKYGVTPERYTFINPSTGRSHRYHDDRYYARQHIINETPAVDENQTESSGTNTADTVHTGSKRGIEALESKSSQPKKAKKTAGLSALPPELQKWQNKQAELRAASDNPAETPASDVNAINTNSEQPTSDEQSFVVDTEQHKRCYLCNTKFTTSEILMRHLGESETHAAYAKDDDRQCRGFDRLRKNGVDFNSTIKIPARKTNPALVESTAAEGQQQAPQWRDRAAERRQGDATAPAQKVSFSLKPKVSAAQKSRRSSSGSDETRPAFGRGREMLQRAGWSEGQALGDGSGISAPIEQSMYAAGVGLGHEGSRRGDALAEADRRTRDERGDFLEQTKENARQRYERMG